MKMSTWCMSLLRLPLLLYLLAIVAPTWSYVVDLGGRITKPTCVPIPSDMSLCANIGYKQMRMPNLLDHDSIPEVKQQASSWVPLLSQRCHPETQLFLCSLFAPVCLDRPIYPCRSLCEKVRDRCSPVMLVHGYPWPDMLRCDKLPRDNDLCITDSMKNSTSEGDGEIIDTVTIYEGESPIDSGENPGRGTESVCERCQTDATEDKIITEYCNADFVVKSKIQETTVSKGDLKIVGKKKKKKLYKKGELKKKDLKKMTFFLEGGGECNCEFADDGKDYYLIMGRQTDKKLVVTFVMPWSKSRELRKASRRFKKETC